MADDDADAVTLLTQLMQQLVTARIQQPRPKAIQCRMYRLSQSWPDFATHFVQCVKAAYAFNLPADQDALDEACVVWLPSKLEPGPTLVAYDSLDEAVKQNWGDLVDALTTAYADDTERELFLADVASFRRGDKGLVEFKNELLRRMRLYQPGLSDVPKEFQRQAVSRFIEGMDDVELKRKMRRHCKRENLDIEKAFNYAVDHEASTLQTRIREGEAAALIPKSFAAVNMFSDNSKPVHIASKGDANVRGEFKGIHDEIKGLSAKHKISEMQINELCAKSAQTDDRITIVSKEVGQVAVNVAKLENAIDGKLSRIESLILANQSGNFQQSNSQPQYGNPYFPRPNQFPRQPYRGRGGLPYAGAPRQFQQQQQPQLRQPYIQPSLTGGAGYVNNQVRPSQFRLPNPQMSAPARPAANVGATTTPPIASIAAFGPVGSPSAVIPSTSVVAAAAAAAGENLAAVHPCADQQQQRFDIEESSWWSPAMGAMGATGYNDTMGGTYTYGNEDFRMQ